MIISLIITKNFNVYFSHCEFKLKFDINFITQNIKTEYVNNMESESVKSQILLCIDCMKFKGYNFHNITHITCNTKSHECNATYEHCMRYPMHMVERRIKFIFAKIPSLINSFDRKKTILWSENIHIYLLITNKCIYSKHY